VLVTGASGFIGSRTLPQLVSEGYEVHALSRRFVAGNSALSIPGVRWHQVDLLDGAATATVLASIQPQLLLHFAWISDFGVYWESPQNLNWSEATKRLVRLFRESGGHRAVLAGSCAEYQWSEDLLSESSTPFNPATLYGKSKHATRLYCEDYAARTGLGFVWGRIFFVYGPGEDRRRLVPSVILPLLAGHETLTTSGTQVRDFSHVDDVAAGFVALLEGDESGTLNVASGNGVTVREVVERIAAVVGRPDLLRVGALEQRLDDPAFLVADVARLRALRSGLPRIDLEEGLRATVSWWREIGDHPTVPGLPFSDRGER
jgi:nucleoside-diphosphate-sugar epimerase